MNDARILVAGSSTLAGQALCRRLRACGFSDVIAADLGEVADLETGPSIAELFARASPEYVFVTAGQTVGIGGNERRPADLMIDNLEKSTSILEAAFESGVRKLVYFASIANDPHVTIWGSGAPRREFIYADDLADACVHVMQSYEGREPINIGTGADCSIAELASLVRDVVGYRGELRFDRSRPNGVPFKALDSLAMRATGWHPAWTLEHGLQESYEGFLSRLS